MGIRIYLQEGVSLLRVRERYERRVVHQREDMRVQAHGDHTVQAGILFSCLLHAHRDAHSELCGYIPIREKIIGTLIAIMQRVRAEYRLVPAVSDGSDHIPDARAIIGQVSASQRQTDERRFDVSVGNAEILRHVQMDRVADDFRIDPDISKHFLRVFVAYAYGDARFVKQRPKHRDTLRSDIDSDRTPENRFSKQVREKQPKSPLPQELSK